MSKLDLSLSPRPDAHFAVLNGADETGFVIARGVRDFTRVVWHIRHALGNVVTEMIGREIQLEYADFGEAFETLEAFLRLERTDDVTKMKFKPMPGAKRRLVDGQYQPVA